MRRTDREVTEFSRILEILARCDCCRLGLADDGEVYIVPMNFGYAVADGHIILYFHCANEGRKLRLISRRPAVSFEMDTKHDLVRGRIGCDFSYLYQSIMGTGVITVLSSREEKLLGLQTIMAHYTGVPQWDLDDTVLDGTTVLKLSVKTLSCKAHELPSIPPPAKRQKA